MTEANGGLPLSASAPGKVLLCGEYAVLDGAPAICMAINRRVHVSLSAAPGDHHVVTSPGFTTVTGRFRSGDRGFEWLEGAGEFALVESIWQTARPRNVGPLSVELESGDCYDDKRKMGMGSSAAMVVALAGALCSVAETDGTASAVAFAAHRHWQGGLGSGVDVACSISGGLVEYSMGMTPGECIDWPAGLVAGFVDTGTSASTRDKLERLGKQVARPSRAALVLAARRLAQAWSRGVISELLTEYRDYVNVLGEFSADYGLGIFDAGHAELAAAAAARGLVYKPCGAGGGDIGVVLATDPDAVRDFFDAAGDMGARPLDLQLDPCGFRVEGMPG